MQKVLNQISVIHCLDILATLEPPCKEEDMEKCSCPQRLSWQSSKPPTFPDWSVMTARNDVNTSLSVTTIVTVLL